MLVTSDGAMRSRRTSEEPHQSQQLLQLILSFTVIVHFLVLLAIPVTTPPFIQQKLDW